MKNANLIFVLTATASVFLPGMTTGYELSTHAGMTNVTYDKSILSVSSTYDRLGLTTRSQESVGEIYFDLADAGPQPIVVRPRTRVQYELDNLPGKFIFPNKERFGVRPWMMRGAIREDDASATLSVLKTGSPTDDPYGNINRFCNHFFDPVNVRALSKFCFNSTLDMSPNWAIGTTDAFANPVNRASFYRNHFTVFSAREAMWRALTLKDQFGSRNIASGTSAAALEAERLAYWATVFRALGDVAHLIQDMAQEQPLA